MLPLPGRIDVGVVEGIDRVARGDFEVKARVGCQAADAELDPVGFRVPEEEDFVRPVGSSGEFSSVCAHSVVPSRATSRSIDLH